MIRSLYRRLSSQLTRSQFVRTTLFANRRRATVLALFVLAAVTLGGYAAGASSSGNATRWQQLVSRYETKAKSLAHKFAPSLFPAAILFVDTLDDYRSAASGNWNAVGTWERFDGTNWVPAVATPTSTNGVITIRSPHVVTITATVTYDQVVVDPGGQVTVASAVTHTLANGTGTDLTINGTWLNSGGAWTVTGATWAVGSGGTYIHNTTSSAATPLGVATFDATSTMIYRGSSTLTPAVSLAGRTFGNLSFESTSGSWSVTPTGATSLTINGDFTIGSGVTITNQLTGTTTIAGSFTNNGSLTNSTGTQIFTFTGSNKTISGSGAISFETFNVSAGASLTANSAVTEAATFACTISGTFATAATFTNSGTTTVNGTFQVNQGGSAAGTAFTYGASSTLSYNGTSAQTSTSIEFPSSSGPASLTINNAGGVTLHAARTISGTLTLTSGKLTTTSANLLTVSNTAANAVSGGSSTAYVNGPLARLLPASLASGSTYSFPVGKAGYNPFELVNPTTNSGGTVTIQAEEFDGSSGGSAGTGLGTLNTDRYWQASAPTGGANFTNTTVRLTDSTVTAANVIGQSSTKTGSYNSIGGTVSGSTITSNTVTGLNFFNIGTAATPTITVTGGPLSFGDRVVGAISTEQTYTVAGSNLTADITVTAPSTDFQVSKTTGTGFGSSVTFTQSGGTVATQTVYVRFTPQSAGAKSGNVTNASTGATTKNVAVSGTGVACPSLFTVDDTLDTPDANPGDGVCDDGSTDHLCTLRAAIMEANALAATACSPLTIDFSVIGTISLGSALPAVNHPNLTISGPGADQITVERSTAPATPDFRIFDINNGKTVNISGLTLTNGKTSAGQDGGAISNSGTLGLSEMVFSGNTAGQSGGAISNSGALTVSSSTISGNTAQFDAGILTDGISATISNTTISGNTATVGQSGALKNQNGTVTLTNCTVSGNNSDALINLATGGATASITLTACTVTDGGLLSFDNGGATSAVINLKNTIVSHTGTTLGTGGTNASIVSQGNNLTNDGGGGFLTGTGDLINANPLLAALGNYGGTTETRPLLPGSPAINAGTSSGAPTNDQRGSSRVGNVDIGAFESQGFAIGITGNGSNQSTTVLTNFANSLTVSIGANNAGEPVNGGQVTFTPPGTGASCTFAGNPATISSNAASSGTVTANATAGSYSVAAGATGATSVNFSLTNLPANTAPSFATVATPSRQQGSAASNSTIATVTDAETAAGSLIVTITSANPSNGVTVSNIQNSGGTITADIVADCTASNASFTLQVSDGSLTGIGTLNVSVTANSAPTVGTYADKTLLTGKNVTVTPSAAPADNGSIASVTATASPNTFTGTFSGNATTGALTITNAAPAGTYTITVTVTDNCGATVQKTFTLTVNPCPTSFTVNNLSDVSDSNAGDGVCATSGGVCTLRAAIEEANALASSCSPLSINFSVTGTITLANGQLLITHPSLTVNGPGASQLTVTGNNASRVFEVNIASTTTINGLTITGGNGIGATDSGSGGGVYSKGKLTLTGCVVTGNTTTGPTIHEGGGVFNAGNQLMTLTNCTISNNTANFGGAGVISFGNLVMTGCTVANNTNTYTSDSGRGGGVETYATTTITNSTISGNHIDNGTGDNAGGVWNCCGPLTIINSTITGNSAAGNSGAPSAGGLLQDSCCGGSVTVLNSIIAGNTGTGGAVADVSGAFVSNGYNLIGDGTGATGFTGTGDQVGTTVTPINPRLATLGSYGGTTQTHALLPGSPAINAGTSSGAPTADQRGSSRFGTTDIGAFESQGFTLAATSGSGQSAVINTAFGLPLKATVMANNAGEPVNGGVVTFTPPVSGASATVAGSPVTIAGGMATTGTVTANAVTGNYSVAASANGATGTNFALTNTCQTITVTNPATTTGTIGTPFSQTFTQTGGIGTTTFSTAGALPTGLTLASNGTLSGTPMQSGTFPITVTATDSNGCTGTGATYTLVINTAGCVSSLTVNNSGDGADATPGDGVCETATGNGFCTLRAAIEESNALTSCTPFTINFSITGTINLASELPYLEHPNLTIQGPGATQLTVTRNAAAQFGIFTVVSDVAVINDLTVSNGNSTDLAGGIYGDKNLTINRCVITGNTAARGGGVVSEGGTISINNSTISGNTATAEGGGVFNWGNEGTSQVTLTNCTISGNTVTAAGGNATAGGLASYAEVDGTAVINLVNCTISGNTATNAANAGGLFSGVEDAGSTADINLKNTILANNSNTQALAGADATITSQGNNLASDNAGGFLTGSGDLTNTNPLLATLANYGGTTQTYALLPGSPAINAGTSSGAPTNDQRGKLRFGATDIGAFESQGFSLAATSGTPQSAVISTAFGLPLKVTVTANDAGEPVNGGKVTFTPPGSGASAAVVGSPVTIASGMATTGTVTANAITGSYNVAASATGATGVNFALTNTCQTITVNNPVANTGTVGTFFTATFTQTGSIGATTFSTTSTLPNGITLSNAGVLSGTPTQTGAFPITVKATDSNNCMGTSVGYTLTINCPTITLSPTTLPGGTINALYSGATITATGGSGSYGFAVTGGALPGGMSLSSGGVLGGTPAQAGFFQFTVTATDANNCTGTRTYGLQVVGTMANCNTVVRAPLAGSFALNQWTSANLAGSATVAITSTIGRSGAGSLEFNSPGSSGKADAIYYWSTSLGNAVAGRTLGSLTGLKFEFYRDDTSTNPAVQYPALRLFFMTPSGKSGYLIWEWANNGIPGTPPTNQWVSQNILSGNFWMRAFGSPSKTIDLYNVTLAQWAGGAQFTDGDGDMAHVLGPDTYILGIEVGIGSGWSGTAHAFADNVFAQFGTSDTICANFEPACNTITFTPASLPAGTVGTLYNQTIVAGSGYSPYTLSLSGTLPNGITFTPATGALSGTPTQSGSFPIIINATDVSGCTGSVNYTLTVNCPTITVNPASLPNGVVGTAYNQTITPSGGSSANYTYSFTGTLPPGLTLSGGPSATGTLSGNPTAGGTYNFTIIATDANGCAGNRAYTVTINQAPAFTSANTTTFTVNTPGTFTVTTSGLPTVTSITRVGSLPTGVSFVDNGNGTATLSGTPAIGTNGNYPLTFTASNGVAPNATQNFTLVVNGLVCPSTLTVNDLGDASDANPGDGLCATSGGVCTLRAAIEEANAITACSPLTINFSVTGTINLATALPNLNHPNLTINGPGANQLDVHRNAVALFRIFTVNSGKTVAISGLSISNGNVTGADGGGVFSSGNLTLTNCAITDNQTNGEGGGVYSTLTGALTLSGCTVSGNTAATGGGVSSGTVSSLVINVTNSTISGNTAATGGGINIDDSTTTMNLLNVTIANNTATSIGGGIARSAGTINFKNTIVAGNTAPSGTDISGIVVSQNYNLIGSTSGATINGTTANNITGVSAQLGSLGNNGGATHTHLPLPGSPAIDKGSAGTSADQRGQSRPFDFPGVANAASGNGSDIGAVEIQCSPITLAGLPGGAVGVPYTASNIGGGGTAPYTLSVTDGSLPPGVTISGNGLAGTPTQIGTYSFVLQAQDAYGCTGSQSYTVSVVCPTIVLSPSALPAATINTAYPQTITASPALAYNFSVTNGLLPTGLTLNSNGSFSGAPTNSGTFNFRVTASFGGCSAFADYVLVVNCPTITLAPTSLPGGTLGTAYNQSVTASPAGSYFYSVTSGALPAGLMLNGATGAITGTPVIAGTFNFTVRAAAGACSASRSYTVTVACQSVSITSITTLTATAGSAYSHTISVSPAGNYTFVLTQGNLPSGVTLNPVTGVISGLPIVVGTVSFKIGVQLPNSCVSEQSYTMNVVCPPVVTLSPTTLPNGSTGAAYNQTLSATPAGGNYVYAVSVGSLPTGLNLNPATGSLSGTPSANGTFNFTVTATGFGSCSGSRAYTIVIGSGGCPTISLPASLPGGSVGQLYSNSVAASPAGSYSYTSTGTLPPGVSLYGSFGLLLGYPTANGTYNFSVTATDANNCSATQSYSVVIGAGNSPATVNDFSGDRRSDFALWREAQTQWLIVDSATGAAQIAQWGQAGDRPVTGDFDGDGKADLAGFGKDGHWRVKLSGGGTVDKVWGLGSDTPVAGDYDGDGKTDLAVWRGAETNWYILRSSDGQTQTVQWGSSLAPYNDLAVPGDYDGDGKTDIAVFRQANGSWYIRRSSDGKVVTKAWGLGTDVPVPADFDGDGKTDIAVWRGSEGNWYIVQSSTGATETKFWGAGYAPYLDTPAVGDYDGDGKADAAVWRKSDNRWYVLQSSDGTARTVAQGRAGDAPVIAQPRP